jgi:hypothetical protein
MDVQPVRAHLRWNHSHGQVQHVCGGADAEPGRAKGLACDHNQQPLNRASRRHIQPPGPSGLVVPSDIDLLAFLGAGERVILVQAQCLLRPRTYLDL